MTLGDSLLPTGASNAVRQKIGSGGCAICLPIRVCPAMHVLQMATAAGFDAVYYDLEHGSLSPETVATMTLAALPMAIEILVRVPNADPTAIVKVLEGGASGVIVPHVETEAEARAIVQAARFPPTGARAIAGASAPLAYSQRPLEEQERVLDERTLVVAMVESTLAVSNADRIAAVDGIDVVLVGTGDLSAELGIHGQYSDPRIRTAYETVARACRDHGRALGVAGVKDQPDVIKSLRRLGALFITASTDESLLLRAMRNEADKLREACGAE